MTPRRQAVRRWLFLAGALPAVLVLAFALKVALMLSHAGDGSDRFSAQAYAEAADEYGANRTLNLLEPWVAPFDEGASRHAAGEYDVAVERYTEALADVPAEEECVVRTNLALAHEALGGEALGRKVPDLAAAKKSWQAGVDALAEGDCAATSPDAKSVDDRLRKLLADEPPKKDPKDPEDEEEQEPEQEEEPDPKQDELNRRNNNGSTERNNLKQREGDANLGGPIW